MRTETGSREDRSRPRRLAVIALLAVVLAGSVWLGLRLNRLWRAATAVRTDLNSIESLASDGFGNLEPKEALGMLHETRADLQALHDAAGPFLWLAPRLGWVPRYGPDIEAAPTLLEIALDLTAAGEDIVEPLAPLLEQVADERSSGGTALVEEATARLADARPQMRAAQSAIRDARGAREELVVGALDPRLQGWVERVDRYLPLMEQGVRGALLAPELLGADGPRSYLMLVQNEDELRATGGFISGVVRANVEDGQLLGLKFEDCYAVDDFSEPYPEPPPPLREYMLADLWVFRDANWSPDFPTSAQAAIDLYTISRDVDPDGVIALDQRAIRLLVGALEPLEPEGYPEPITGGNVIRLARQAWAPGEEIDREWWRHRKDFMAGVLDAAIRRLEGGLDRERLLNTARAAFQALRQKHLLLYVEDEQAASLLKELGWDGAIEQPQGDYLTVVDTNVGFNKANGLVEQSLEYTVDLTDLSQPRATLLVRHAHPLDGWEGPCRQNPRYDATYRQMMERCYWDYLRVYVPGGTRLLDASPHRVSGEALLSGRPSPAEVEVRHVDSGHQVLATFLLVRPGQTLETRFRYALPGGTLQVQGEKRVYDLTVQKQPGTLAVPLQLRVLLPAGARVVESDPKPESAAGPEITYSLPLETDKVVTLTFNP